MSPNGLARSNKSHATTEIVGEASQVLSPIGFRATQENLLLKAIAQCGDFIAYLLNLVGQGFTTAHDVKAK